LLLCTASVTRRRNFFFTWDEIVALTWVVRACVLDLPNPSRLFLRWLSKPYTGTAPILFDELGTRGFKGVAQRLNRPLLQFVSALKPGDGIG
jgi:hypothetical protein